MPTATLQRIVIFLIAGLALAIFIHDVRPPANPGGFDINAFAALPVQEGGRVKPMDTIARTSLLMIAGKQSYRDAEGRKVAASEWLAELILHPQAAAGQPVFRIDHPDLVGLLGFHNEQRKFFTMREIAAHFETLREQFATIPEEAHLRDTFQRALLKLQNAIALYDRLSYMVLPPPLFGEASLTFQTLERLHRDTLTAAPGTDDHATVGNAVRLFSGHFAQLETSAHAQVVPPNEAIPEWHSIGTSLLAAMDSGKVDPVLVHYEQLAAALKAKDANAFNGAIEELQSTFAARSDGRDGKVGFESFFNAFAPFYFAMEIYLIVLMVAAFSWLGWSRLLAKAALALLLFAFASHTFGMIARIYIQERPPVTNLYSSAIFVSWAAIPLCLLLERRALNGMASAAAAILGFTTLIIAHHLSFSGDTLEMMRAVLDSNFWLATHVPTVTVGYSASFLAGFLAIVHIVRSCFQKPDPQATKTTESMIYGTICFALLFSFVGTVLGGIWADQSWGRFWGWDPKENGALMIVLWNAVILHARWAKIAKPVHLMQMAIVGNIITAWSWFGTNMLGVGLHSYGFMDAAFFWLVAFVASQLIVIALPSILPRRFAATAQG